MSKVQVEGRPPMEPDGNIRSKIHGIIIESNKLGIPNSAGRISNTLRDEHGIVRSARSITRDLHSLRMFWGKGVRQNMMHDAPQNVAYRLDYLNRRLANLSDSGNKLKPRRPEEIRDAKVIADNRDYHGSFTAPLFESIFKKVLENLKKMGFGPCHIHLDGASYHFNKIGKKPSSNAKVADQISWLREGGHELPSTTKKDGVPKKEELARRQQLAAGNKYAMNNAGSSLE
ncbi:hypothetical protein BGX27_000073 [Mortierella sp. AM989]|nr:hypothetical protein BGX27_000073 [Mortierella sp. AM989]